MTAYCTISDINILWKRTIKESEEDKAETLINIVSASLRSEAKKVGKDLDKMIEDDPDLLLIAKDITVSVVGRYLDDTSTGPAMSQMSQSAGGYSVSGTYLVPGGGIFIKKSELARLGLRRQQMRFIDYDYSD
jgi:hypothetical protein